MSSSPNVQLDLEANHVWADADGLGISMCSDLDAAIGSTVNRFHGVPYDDSGRAAIARSRGWQYTGNKEDARAKMYGDSGGRPGRGDDGGWPGEGFGGVHGGW